MDTEKSMPLDIAKRMPRASHYSIDLHPILFKNVFYKI